MAAGDCPVRDVLDRLGDAWTLLVVLSLGEQAVRFGELRRAVRGCRTDAVGDPAEPGAGGLVDRRVTPATPPQVEYALTEMGRSLAVPIQRLSQLWVSMHTRRHQGRAGRYDAGASQPGTEGTPNQAAAPDRRGMIAFWEFQLTGAPPAAELDVRR